MSRSHPRSTGKAETPSRPVRTRSHSSSGEVTPPGKRHPIPTIAMGSSGCPVSPGTSASAACSVPSTSASRYDMRAVGVGWSKISEDGSRSPVASFSRLRSSTPVRESKPRSLKVRAGFTAAAEPYSSTVAICVRTNCSSVCPRSSSEAAARRSRQDSALTVSGSSATCCAVSPSQ
ncbi:hypothetical protein SGLAM104S_06054 [Streptomyces glaucescens]